MASSANLLTPPPAWLGSGYPQEPVVARILAHERVQRVPSPKLTLFVRREFLDEATCAALCERIEANRRPSTITDHDGDASYRTSETCDLYGTDPLVAEVDARLSAFTGIDPAHGEALQGQRYAVGQEFKQHTDYFEPTGRDFAAHCTVSGQRTWTVMVYLNEPEAGGATRFKAVDKMIQPERGKLVAWNNLRPDGSPNPATLHTGMKVRAGVKMVITKWYRERPWG